ncbi:hypothetical protein BS78_09G012600 [Paspalum vaginatum]|nr:hypothetical protein BS78_09G012600 [Paspalum vaginatum]
MAPAWVLLDSCVRLRFDGEDDGSAAAAVKTVPFAAFSEAAVALLGSMKPDPILADPPRIATFSLLGSESHRRLGYGMCPMSRPLVACADKSLLVLYARPGSCGRGNYYIVFDAASPLLSTVPAPPQPLGLGRIGVAGTVVLRRQPPSSGYLLAELAVTPTCWLPDAELYLWRSDEPTPQWAKKAVRLPPEACSSPGKHSFVADASAATSFSAPGGTTTETLCWVDLLNGIVACTNPTQDDPVLRFIPLPDECPAVGCTDERRPKRPHVGQIRGAACVGGAIKLVAMVGALEGWDPDQFRLTAWTLSPDLTEWQQDGVFLLKDIWAADEYRARVRTPSSTRRQRSRHRLQWPVYYWP